MYCSIPLIRIQALFLHRHSCLHSFVGSINHVNHLYLADSSQQLRYDVVLFDVDSKDSTVGMSCPPRSFVEAPLVAAVRDRVLKPEGIDRLRLFFIIIISLRFT